MEAEKYILMAEEYHRLGMKLLEEEDYYDAAEKIWASVKTATAALTQRYLGRIAPPKGVYWRDFVAEAFMKAGLKEDEARVMASYFMDVRSKLHGECFYGLIYEEPEHKPLMEKAKNYLDHVRRLVEA